MKIEKILLLSKGSGGPHLRMYKENVQRDRRTYHLELGSGGPRARWRASGVVEGLRRGGGHGGGARARAVEAARGRRGRRCHGRRTDGGARKKRAAVFDEEEDERIDLRQALEVIYQRELLPVPATNRE